MVLEKRRRKKEEGSLVGLRSLAKGIPQWQRCARDGTFIHKRQLQMDNVWQAKRILQQNEVT